MPAPAPGDVLLVVGPPRGRSEPEVPVDHVARRSGLARQPGRLDRRGVDRGEQRVDLAELAALRQPDGGLEIRHAAPLGAGLEDPLGLPDRIVQGLAQPDRQTAGLLAVNVLSGLGGEDRRRGVPAVARPDQHGVDVRPRQQLAEVAVEDTILVAVVLVDEFLPRFAPAGLHVADGHAPHVGLRENPAEIVRHARADADHPQRDPLRGGRRGVQAEGLAAYKPGDGHRGPRRDRPPKQLAPRQVLRRLSHVPISPVLNDDRFRRLPAERRFYRPARGHATVRRLVCPSAGFRSAEAIKVSSGINGLAASPRTSAAAKQREHDPQLPVARPDNRSQIRRAR